MGFTGKAVVERPHVFMDHRVVANSCAELFALRCGRQLAVNQQVGDLQEVTICGELFDRITAISQNSIFTVQIGDRAVRAALGRRGGLESIASDARAISPG